MELILKSNNQKSIAQIIALAKQLNVIVEQRENIYDNETDRKALKDQILTLAPLNNPPMAIR